MTGMFRSYLNCPQLIIIFSARITEADRIDHYHDAGSSGACSDEVQRPAGTLPGSRLSQLECIVCQLQSGK